MEISKGAIVLSGGKSSRMGKNKAFLEVGSKRILDHIVDTLQTLIPTENIILVTNSPQDYAYLRIKTVTDLIAGLGPLSGIHAGLYYTEKYYNLVVACDMPFISVELAQILFEEAAGFDVAVPKIEEKLHPLFAVYAKNCLKPIEKALKKGIYQVAAVYPELKVNYVNLQDLSLGEVDLEKVLVNVNTPEDLEKAKRII